LVFRIAWIRSGGFLAADDGGGRSFALLDERPLRTISDKAWKPAKVMAGGDIANAAFASQRIRLGDLSPARHNPKTGGRRSRRALYQELDVFKIVPTFASVAAAKTPAAGASSPWPPSAAFVAALVLCLLAVLALAIDVPLAQYIKGRGLPGELRRLVRLAELFGWGGTVALIIFTAAAIDPRGWRIVPRLALGSLGAGLVADGLKLFVARLRPSAANLNEPVRETFVAWLPLLRVGSLGREYSHALQSFPSAHAATAAGLAVALATLYPRGRWLFCMFALLACIQRLEAQAHFTSDVLAGAALGCLVAAVCQMLPGRIHYTLHSRFGAVVGA
jgi:membrane-associated phospholipid phosphatase